MNVALHDTVRVEGHAEGDELVTRIFLGDLELDVNDQLRASVLALLGGSLQRGHVDVLLQRGVLAPPPGDPVPEVLQLRRTVRLEVVPVPQRVKLAGADGPLLWEVMPWDLASEGWIPRFRLAPLQKLHEAVRAALPYGPSTPALLSLTKAVLADLPALDEVVEITEDGLVPLVPLQEAGQQYELHLRFFGDRNPALARQVARALLRIAPDRFATIGRGLSALQDGVHGLALKELFSEDRGGKQMVLGFIGRGMVASPVPHATFDRGAHYLGKGSVLVVDDTSLWVDPVYPVSSSRDAGPPAIPRPDALLFTRSPMPDTLFRAPRDIPVYVATGPGPAALPDRTADLARAFGFDVRELPVGAVGGSDGVRIEHHTTGALVTAGGRRRLFAHAGDGVTPPCDQVLARAARGRIGDSVAGLFLEVRRWTDRLVDPGQARAREAGLDHWIVLDDETQGRSRTFSVLDDLVNGPVPEGGRVAAPGPLT
jgi:hypothetical protein